EHPHHPPARRGPAAPVLERPEGVQAASHRGVELLDAGAADAHLRHFAADSARVTYQSVGSPRLALRIDASGHPALPASSDRVPGITLCESCRTRDNVSAWAEAKKA